MPDIQIILVTLILFSALFLLVTETVSVDKTGLFIIVSLALSGILTPKEAVSGFSNPAVLTVGAMFLLSRGLIRTGAVGVVTQGVTRLSRKNKTLAFILILTAVALASAFINNTPVVVLFIPIVMGMSCQCDFSPSKMLIPLSYASILAGTCTLIGTSTNIIVSDLAAAQGLLPLSMFELGKIGVPIAIAGLVFLVLAAPRLMPGRVGPVCELDEGKEKRYLAELVVPDKSQLIGRTDIISHAQSALGLDVIEIFRKGHILDPSRNHVTMKKEDILLVKGAAEDLVSSLKKQVLELAHGEEGISFGSGIKDDLIIELIVPPLSTMLKEPLLSTRLKNDPDIRIIAIRSRRSHYSYRKIRRVKLKIGDTILIRCPRNRLPRIRRDTDFLIVEDIHDAIIDREKAGFAAAIFAGVVLGATLGLADIMVCALTGVALMALTHCLSLKDAYRSLDSEVLLLIIGTIALGLAMEKTGASRVYAGLFLSLFQGMGPAWVLSAMILLSSISTHILSNNATAVLLMPIALSSAASLGADPRPFIVGICFGASACFATPIGYQTNLMVYGPGGYRFSDYLKLGLPLNLLVIVLSSLMIPRVWPF